MNITVASLIWDVLLQAITKSKSTFYISLVNQLLEELIKPSAMDANIDDFKSAIFQWLVHLTTAKGWKKVASVSQHDLQTQIAETTLLTPSVWGHKLVKAIVDRADEEFRELWGPLYEASTFDEPTEEMPLPSDGPKTNLSESDIETSSANSDLDMDDERSHDTVPSKKARLQINAGKTSPQVPTAKRTSECGWSLWEGGWVPRPIGI